MLTWLRVSLSFLDEGAWQNPKAMVKDIEIPPIKGTLGLSYVWNEESTIEKLEKINQYAQRFKASFVRIVPNCLNVHEQEKYKDEIIPIMNKFPNFFFQTKSYEVYPNCMIGWLKPYLNADGYIYHCSANPLIEQKFHPNFRICHMTEVKETWKNPHPADISCCEKGKCFYSEQNRLIDCLKTEVPHKNFI
jgi:MoaA/NifB/PqqE/SkfB family radical SAM enzyme